MASLMPIMKPCSLLRFIKKKKKENEMSMSRLNNEPNFIFFQILNIRENIQNKYHYKQ